MAALGMWFGVAQCLAFQFTGERWMRDAHTTYLHILLVARGSYTRRGAFPLREKERRPSYFHNVPSKITTVESQPQLGMRSV